VNLTKGILPGLGNGFPHRPAHVISHYGYGIGRNEFALPFGARGLLQSVRRASTATAGQPKLDVEEEQSEDQKLSKRKKEASPEECDQAVEGLSTAKAKAKAKQLQESLKSSQSIMQKLWARLLGIGPALQVVASMSRYMIFSLALKSVILRHLLSAPFPVLLNVRNLPCFCLFV
jgi:LETM1 and EF-hand domain-containing protein 1